jgi:Ca2+-binding RTX toxin-like protein
VTDSRTEELLRSSTAQAAAFVTGFTLAVFVGGVAPKTAEANTAGCQSSTINTQLNQQTSYTDAPGYSRTLYLHDRGDKAEMGDCSDTVYAGQGPDEIHGATDADFIYGQDGHDRPSDCDGFICGKLFGGAGYDRVEGGSGGDHVDDSQAGSDQDSLHGNEGSDFVNAKDGDPNDFVYGGADFDDCEWDSPGADTADATCET